MATRFSRWLEIEDLPCLRESTMLGVPFRGNSIYETTEAAPHKQSTAKYKSSTHALERRALEFIYHKHMERLGYKPDFISSRSSVMARLAGLFAWCVPFKGELTWILSPKSRAFADREPSRVWLRGLWRGMPAFAKVLRRSLVLYFLVRSVPIFLMQRIVIFSRMAIGKYKLDPEQIIRDAAGSGPLLSILPRSRAKSPPMTPGTSHE